MDLNRLTVRARGALEGAHQQAVARNHQQIEPVHILFGLLGDPEGIVYPVLHALGVQPKTTHRSSLTDQSRPIRSSTTRTMMMMPMIPMPP